jgi:hypothetical protein
MSKIQNFIKRGGGKVPFVVLNFVNFLGKKEFAESI